MKRGTWGRRLLGVGVVVSGFAVTAGGAWAEAPCSVLIRKEQPGPARTVLLSGGDAAELFRRYVTEAEKRGVNLSLWKSRAVVSVGKERKEFSLNWIEMLTGQGAKERWATRLRGVKAEADEEALQEADRQQWDVVCHATAREGEAGTAPPAAGREEVSLAAKQHLHQGIQYAARRDYDNAVNEFSLAIQKHPRYAAAYANRAVAYMQQKKFNLAMDDLKKAVEIDPKDPNVHYNLACWYSLQRQFDRAFVSLDAALAHGFRDYETLRQDPQLAELRKQPDWRKTLERHKVFLH